jgi:hypothetical protein
MKSPRCVVRLTAGLFFFLSVSLARAQIPCDPPQTPQTPQTPTPSTQQPQTNPSTENNQFAQAPAAGTEAAGSFDPGMMGDEPGILVQRCVPVTVTVTRNVLTLLGCNFTYHGIPNNSTPPPITIFVPAVNGVCTPPATPPGHFLFSTTNVDGFVPQTFTQVEQVCQEILESTRSGYKIAEGESPQPQDRVFFDYNLYGSALTGINSLGDITKGDINRETFGFEKTFLDGNASIGLRAPLLQEHAIEEGFGQNDFGDMTVITKFAPFYDHTTGDLVSFGLCVTAPTGPAIVTTDFTIHDWLLQPWTGFVLNSDRWYLEGFCSVAVPTDSQDVTLLFNDLSVGYRLYRGPSDSFLSGFAPLVEAHVTTPLDHRGPNEQITLPDFVDLTFGAHFELYGRSLLTLGVNTPVTGPRLYGLEGIAQFTWRF